MIKLYQFPRALGIPNGSSFCMKTETFLRMAGLEYEVVELMDPRKAPKGKVPYIEDNGRTIADSTFVQKYLEETHGVDLDASLNPTDRAVAHAFGRMLEERYYWVLIYCRWIDDRFWPTIKDIFFRSLPALIRPLVARSVRKGMRAELWHHGLGRHTEDEIYALGAADLDALAAFLDEKPFFMGDEPTAVDATVYASLANTLVEAIDSPVRRAALGHPNLPAYTDRMTQRFFPDP